MRNTLRLLLLSALLTGCGQALMAQSAAPSRQEVEQYLSAGRHLLSEGPIPEDFHRSLKEWYNLSSLEGWHYGDPRLRRRNNSRMEESYRLYSMLTNGVLTYGDPISRWTQSVADQLLSVPTTRALPRCYFLTYEEEQPLFGFSQGVLIVTPSLFSQYSEQQAIALIKITLEQMGYHTRSHGMQLTDCYAQIQELSRRGSLDWQSDTTASRSYTLDPTIVPNDPSPIVILNPCYAVRRANGDLKMKKTVLRHQQLDKDILIAAEAADCKVADYTVASLMRHNDEQFYNEYMLLSHWGGTFQTTAPWVRDTVEKIMQQMGAHQYMTTTVANDEGVLPTMLWSAAAIGVVYSPALVALTTHLFSHSERFYYENDIFEYNQPKAMNLHEQYSLHDEHGYLRSSQYETFCHRMGTISNNPGYLGSHFNVAFGLSMGTPGLASTLGSGIVRGYAIKAVEFKPSVSMEYAIGSNWSLAADLDLSGTQLYVRSDNPANPYNETWNEGYIRTIGLSARYYRHECEAPLGGYLGGGLAMSNVVFPDNSQYDLNQELTRNKLKDFYSLRLVWGRNYIFSRHLLFNYALTFDFPFISALKPFITDNPQSPIYRQDVLFSSTIASGIWYQNTFVIGVKLGYLP